MTSPAVMDALAVDCPLAILEAKAAVRVPLAARKVRRESADMCECLIEELNAIQTSCARLHDPRPIDAGLNRK
jgi:hypothetical protein